MKWLAEAVPTETEGTARAGTNRYGDEPGRGPMADQIRGSIALGRYGPGDDIAGLVAWLVSPDAAFITGTSLKVDWGQQVLNRWPLDTGRYTPTRTNHAAAERSR
jgi:NAD(P)-dependent dehydrogenase (short-subunit alcohol dehydrogenase family)